MVMPRSFSSFSRSGSVPVRARTSALLPWSMCPAVPTTKDRMARSGGPRSLLPARHPEDGLGGLVELGREGQPRFLLGADDEGVVLAGDLDQEQQLVAGEVQDDAVLVLVEEALDQLVAEPEAGLLLLVGDEVVLLPRHLLKKDQLTAREVQCDAADVRHPGTSSMLWSQLSDCTAFLDG